MGFSYLKIRYASIKAAIKISAQVRRTAEVLFRIKVFAPNSADMIKGTRPMMVTSWNVKRPNTSTRIRTGRTFAMLNRRTWRSRRWENETTIVAVCEDRRR
jgi:hypothetical protein